jgi:hypothetical protein
MVHHRGEIMPHTDKQLLLNKYKEAQELVEVGSFYYHYKNPTIYYKVTALGFNEATEEVCVIYQSSNESIIWIRTLNVWLSCVEYQGCTVARFQKAII